MGGENLKTTGCHFNAPDSSLDLKVPIKFSPSSEVHTIKLERYRED